MDIITFLEKGYLPKELPPAFNTRLFASNYENLRSSLVSCTPRNNESKCISFNIPKTGLTRRTIGIPNPLHQSLLCDWIIENFESIMSIINQSTLSASKPIEDINDRAFIASKTFSDLKNERLNLSCGKKYELTTDISRFYPSIYTHSIAWIMHGKSVAKSRRSDTSLIGIQLDKLVRATQWGQTNGIPVGPDSSFIISEMIACQLDKFFQDKYKNCGIRYYDNYFLYFSSLSDAENAFKYLQSLFNEYQLEFGEYKTKINEIPNSFEDEWSIKLSLFVFDENSAKRENTAIRRFFSLAFENQRKYPNKPVLKYAIGIIKNNNFCKENWELIESLLFHTLNADTSALKDISQILITYEDKVNRKKLRIFINNFLDEQSLKNHNYETSWLLWLAKTFRIKIRKSIAKRIFYSNDVISILIALDLKDKGLIDPNVEISHLTIDFDNDSFLDDKWLLVYEGIIQGWLIEPSSNFIDNNPYLSILKNNNIFFYDDNLQLEKINNEYPHIGVGAGGY